MPFSRALPAVLGALAIAWVGVTPVAAQDGGDGADGGEPGDAGDPAEDVGDAERAEDESDAEPETHARSGPPARRPVPDYDGRGDDPTTPGEALLWVPRIVVSPIYFVTEYLLRRPLGAAITKAEEVELQARVIDAFTFGPNNELVLAPTFSFDFGFRPNIGLYFAWNEAFHPANKVRATIAFGGIDWVSASVADRIQPADSPWSFGIGYRVVKRPDGLFLGVGSEVDENNKSRYRWVSHALTLSASQDLWRQSSVALTAGIRAFEFDQTDGRCNSIPSRVSPPDDCDQAARFDALPSGFEDGFFVWHQGANLVVDTRPERPHPGSGVRLHGTFDLAMDIEDGADERMWVIYGAAVSGHLDLSGHNHVISAQVSAAFADPLQGEVPFTELPVLSGNGPMSGFAGQTLTGDSTFAARLSYHWPVWFWLDGTFHAALGNAFDGNLEGLALDNLRMSFGVGLAAVTRRDHFFELLVGFGTDTLGDGPDVESVRIMFGGTREF